MRTSQYLLATQKETPSDAVVISHQRVRTPVVALTAHILTEHKERARQAGMDGHMSKPVELSQLRELVEFWVEQRELRQTRPQHS